VSNTEYRHVELASYWTPDSGYLTTVKSWETPTLISVGFLKAANTENVVVDEQNHIITITVTNGWARYRIVRNEPDDCYGCELIDSAISDAVLRERKE
jgi:hypothetical protein